MKEQHLGSTIDDFLAEEGLLAEAEAVAWKRVIAYQISQLMREQNMSKAEMARRMQTSWGVPEDEAVHTFINELLGE